jgi:2-keto-3-deoxy-L-rhamnonate aldolase RhmA
MYRQNILKQRLASGRKVFGCWIELLDPAVTEMLSMVGYDFLLADTEHGPGDAMTVAHQLRAAQATDTTVIVRVPWNDPVFMKKTLDVGAEAIMVPMVETGEEAKAAVAACRYPPLGIRGTAHTDIRGSDYGLRGLDYLHTAADNVFVICQVESVKGVENVKAIAATDGVDMVLIGPFDLSASLGKPADFDNPEHKRLMARAEKAVKDAGKFLGTTPYGGCTPAELFARGYDLIVGKPDVSMLRDAALQQVREHKPAG